MEIIELIFVILLVYFLAAIAFFYVFRPEFLVIKSDDPNIVPEVDMWKTFIISLGIAVIGVIIVIAFWADIMC